MKTSPSYGIVANSKTRVWCVFCGVHIPKAAKCIEQHTNGSKHKENIDLMAENGIRYTEGLYCKLCNINIDDESAMKHIVENEEHNTWLTAMEDLVDGEFVNLEAFLGSDENHAYCEVCSQKFDCTLQNVEAHVNSTDHRAKVAAHLKPLNGLFNVENEDEVWCKICDDYIENSTEGILEHIDEDPQHVEWFSELEELIEDHELSIEQYLANEFENNAYCNKCQKPVTCNLNDIENHVNSDDHLSNFV